MVVFRQTRLDTELMKKPWICFRLEIIEKAWDLTDARIKVPCFGLKAAKVWHPSDFRALGYVMPASDTLLRRS